MFITFEQGTILSQFIVLWILCSVGAVDAVAAIDAVDAVAAIDAVDEVAAIDAVDEVDAPHVQRDFASLEKLRFKKDVASTINHRILGIEGNITDLGKQKEASKLKQKPESSEESKAKVEGKVSRLKMQLKETKKTMKEEISQIREELKSAEAQKIHTTAKSIKTAAESIQTSHNRKKRTFFYSGDRYDQWGRKTWKDAREDCKRRGGDLATHLTEQDLNFIFSKVIPINYYPKTAWVGARMNGVKSSFEWMDGDRISNDDGLWHKDYPRPLDQYPGSLSYDCMYITRYKKYRKDGTYGYPYMAYKCASYTPYLCEI